MQEELHFDFRDVLWSPAKALKAKRILVMTVFLLAGLFVYDILTYLALAIEGEKLSTAFSVYGFFPFTSLGLGNLIAQTVYALGVMAAVLVLMLGMFGVAAIEIEAMRGNPFFSARQAITFSVRRLGQLFLAELSIVVFVAFVVLLFAIFGLIARVPIIGPWIYSLFFVIPGFIVAILTVFIIFVLTLSIILLPAVAAAERDGETFGVLLETFSTIFRQPVRWGLYTAYSLVAAKLASFVYAYFSFRAVQLAQLASSIGGGSTVEKTIGAGFSHLPFRSDLARGMFNLFPGIDWSINLSRYFHGSGNDAVSYLMSFMLFLIFLSVVGYALAVIATAQARTFAAIRYMKDTYKITEEDSLFHTDEHVNPPITPEDEEAG